MKNKKSLSKMESLFLCENFIAAQDNKASFIGIFDQINSEKFPFKYERAFLVGVITGEPNSQHIFKILIEDEDGVKIGESKEFSSNYGKNGRTTMAHELIGMPITKVGKVKFRLLVDNIEVGHTRVEVLDRVLK